MWAITEEGSQTSKLPVSFAGQSSLYYKVVHTSQDFFRDKMINIEYFKQ